MVKRIMAWILLLGFLFLILNLIVLRFYWQQSMIVYLVIVFIFLFTTRKGNGGAGKDGYADGSAEGGGSDNTDGRE
jgi:hypothetical protein